VGGAERGGHGRGYVEYGHVWREGLYKEGDRPRELAWCGCLRLVEVGADVRVHHVHLWNPSFRTLNFHERRTITYLWTTFLRDSQRLEAWRYVLLGRSVIHIRDVCDVLTVKVGQQGSLGHRQRQGVWMPKTSLAPPPRLYAASSASHSALVVRIGGRLRGRSATNASGAAANVSASESASGGNADDADEPGMSGYAEERVWAVRVCRHPERS
jgi:hypothetical protein